ncbi:MAG: cyanophycin synthetase [Candidatus Competibacterales bacterium]|nr:cyanophycin synthetase [Candidatus Competibacterales bacterium]
MPTICRPTVAISADCVTPSSNSCYLPFYGLAVVCADDPQVREILPQIGRPLLTYGTGDDCDLRASDIVQHGMRTRFRVQLPEVAAPLEITLELPGRHSVLNALAALAVGLELGVQPALLQQGLARFHGVGRRFHDYGELALPDGGRVQLIDDYGHHPRELAAVLAAIRGGWPQCRLVLAFQPHRYTRTRDLFDDFANVLTTPDALLLTEVYAAGEEPIAGSDGRNLSRAVRARGRLEPVFVGTARDLPAALPGVLRDGDILLTMGAGDIGAVAADLARNGLGGAV